MTSPRILREPITEWSGDEHRTLVAIHNRLTGSLADLARFLLWRAADGEVEKVRANVKDYRAFLLRELDELDREVAAVAAGRRGAR